MLGSVCAHDKFRVRRTGFILDLIAKEMFEEPPHSVSGRLEVPKEAVQYTYVEKEELWMLNQAARQALGKSVHTPDQEAVFQDFEVAHGSLPRNISGRRNLRQVEKTA